ncbi:MAG: rhomboid family intramembrane serine protease [Planctomycetota bacterium]|jgi:membrane associated rhomboid family serine protease
MDEAPELDRVAVFRTTDPRACKEPALVLEAVGIHCELVSVEASVWLVVSTTEAPRARRELRAYLSENRAARRDSEPFVPLSNGLAVGVVWVAALVAARAAALWGLGGVDWATVGRADAAAMVDGGEWWRAMTALLLHADALHLASNLTFGALFAVFLAHAVGSGGAALMMVLSGLVGNVLNAWARYPEHLSVGASTAVFGAVGAFVTIEFLRRGRNDRETIRRWAPMLIGVLILGWFGTGTERTDVTAHLFGFIGGLGIALLAIPLLTRTDRLASPAVQGAAWALAGGIVAGAQAWGLLAT